MWLLGGPGAEEQNGPNERQVGWADWSSRTSSLTTAIPIIVTSHNNAIKARTTRPTMLRRSLPHNPAAAAAGEPQNRRSPGHPGALSESFMVEKVCQGG